MAGSPLCSARATTWWRCDSSTKGSVRRRRASAPPATRRRRPPQCPQDGGPQAPARPLLRPGPLSASRAYSPHWYQGRGQEEGHMRELRHGLRRGWPILIGGREAIYNKVCLFLYLHIDSAIII